MSDLIPFEFEGNHSRVHVDDDGTARWVAKDVCDALGIKQPTRFLRGLDDDEKGVTTIHTPGGPQELLTVTEPGVYDLVLRSRKPEAKAFKRWVKHDVLPALRKTGRYDMQPKAIDLYPELQMLVQMAEGLAEAKHAAALAQQHAVEAKQAAADARIEAIQAQAKADVALAQQQWMTIREYVYLYQLHRQFPPSQWAAFGSYLTGYCFQQGIPVRKQMIADRGHGTENAYHAETLHVRLHEWLLSQGRQGTFGAVERPDHA